MTPDTAAAECARLQRHYKLSQLPVVEDGKLVGVIRSEPLVGASVEHDTRQMLRVANVGSGETVGGPLAASIRTRLPWLMLNLATTFLAAATIALFESTLTRVVVLAAFLPVVAGQGGIGGTQTLTLIVRAIALGELVGVGARRLLTREAVLGLLHGVWLGILVAVIAILWKQNPALGLVLGAAMLGNMVIAGSVGAGVPLFLRRIGVDPAIASAVIVTTLTDIFGFLFFLGIATGGNRPDRIAAGLRTSGSDRRTGQTAGVASTRSSERTDRVTIAFPEVTVRAALAQGRRVEHDGVTVRIAAGALAAFDRNGKQIATHQAFWFAWSQFFPETDVWSGN